MERMCGEARYVGTDPGGAFVSCFKRVRLIIVPVSTFFDFQ